MSPIAPRGQGLDRVRWMKKNAAPDENQIWGGAGGRIFLHRRPQMTFRGPLGGASEDALSERWE
jgi:hypothetical protein